jgi:hypothetical protein
MHVIPDTRQQDQSVLRGLDGAGPPARHGGAGAGEYY